MTRRTLPAVLVLAAFGAGFAHAAVTVEPPARCETVTVTEDTTDDVIAILQSEGWTGDPRDTAERLYSPACPNARTAALLIEHHNR